MSHTHSWNEITNKPDTALRWPTLAEVGAAPAGFGLGGEGASLSGKSCNDALESGFYSIYSSTTDTPYGSGPSGSGMMVVKWGGGAGCFQLFFAYTAARVHVRRRYQEEWQGWFELYSTSKKPTAADVGARPSNWVPSWDDVTGKPGTFPPSTHSHTAADVGAVRKDAYSGDLDILSETGIYRLVNNTITNKPEGAGGHGDHCLHFHWDSQSGYQLYTSYNTGKMWTRYKHGGVWKAWQQVYDSAHLPSAADVGALPSSGGELTGKVQFVGVADAGGLGRYALDLNNHNVGGLNALVFNDPSDAGGEGIFFPKTGKNDSSTSMADYDVLTALDGTLTFNSKKVYNEGDKPSWDDIQNKPTALPPAEHGHAWSDLTGVPVYAQRWPTLSELGAAPSGYGLGTYAVSVPDASINTGLRKTSGFFNGSALTDRPSWPVANAHSWDYFINIAHGNAAGYNGVIAMDFNGQGLAYKAISGGIDKGWNYIYSTSNKPTPGEIGAADLNHGHARQFGSEQTLSTEDLDTIKTPGVYAQHANANTSAARHYPELLAGSLIVTTGAGVQQRYHVYNTSRVWTRAQYNTGGWTPWAREYNTLNKPTAAEVGAMADGGTYGTVYFNNWVRTIGNCGWYNETYGGGLYMIDTTWLRTFNGKKFHIANAEGDSFYTTGGVLADGGGNFSDVYIRSDKRLKTNLVPLSDALEKVRKLTGYEYDKKKCLSATEYDVHEAGLIAQDVQAVLPAATSEVNSATASGNEENVLTISHGGVIALLVEAVKELSEKVKELEHGRT